MPNTDSGMELSKIGPPLNSSTATTSWRRRAESLRADREDDGDDGDDAADTAEGAEPAEADADGADGAVVADMPAIDGVSAAVPVQDSWFMELKPPRSSRPLGPALSLPPRLPQDRIYCVHWGCSGKFTTWLYVDMTTWREAFDHEAFHSPGLVGSVPRPPRTGAQRLCAPWEYVPAGEGGVKGLCAQRAYCGEKLAEKSRQYRTRPRSAHRRTRRRWPMRLCAPTPFRPPEDDSGYGRRRTGREGR